MLQNKFKGEIFQYDIWITDLFGYLKIFTLRDLRDHHMVEGIGFDGSSVPFFGEVNESDFVAIPDPSTMRLYPWKINGKQAAFVIANIYEGYSLKRSPLDSRYVTERLQRELNKRRLRALVSPEMEFFLFRKGNHMKKSLPIEREEGIIHPKQGYFQYPPIDMLYEYRVELLNVLDKVGLAPRKHHHEVGSGQVEINISESDPLVTCDNVQIFKFMAKNVADKMGLQATFMPKPLDDDNGSGMHIHVSLWRDNVNIFHDPNDDYAKLSQVARYFIGGVLYHAEALSAIVAPTINSYKRLIPGFEAPTYICWGRKNRSALIRVPLYHAKESHRYAFGTRIEVRFPDPLANPYLAISAIIYAGLHGIDKKIDPGDPLDANTYHLSRRMLEELNIRELPPTLLHAIEFLESDDYLKRMLGRELIEKYIEEKRKEWFDYSRYITEWEYRRYFHL